MLINGTPEGFFQSYRGLRQGDPLSPLLFILVMEALSRMLSLGVQRGLLECFDLVIASGPVSVSHLLYADNTLVFCGADATQIGHLRCMLLCFEAVSGLKVNLAKFEIAPIGEVVHLPQLAEILGCKISFFPISYLGLPLGATYKDRKV